jgi:hypothetical protein
MMDYQDQFLDMLSQLYNMRDNLQCVTVEMDDVEKLKKIATLQNKIDLLTSETENDLREDYHEEEDRRLSAWLTNISEEDEEEGCSDYEPEDFEVDEEDLDEDQPDPDDWWKNG